MGSEACTVTEEATRVSKVYARDRDSLALRFQCNKLGEQKGHTISDHATLNPTYYQVENTTEYVESHPEACLRVLAQVDIDVGSGSHGGTIMSVLTSITNPNNV